MKWLKHITEEPIRKHFISMPWTVVSFKLGVNFITINVYYVLLKCDRKQLLEVQIKHLFVYKYECNFIGNLHNHCSILRPNITEIIPNNRHNLILTMVITCICQQCSHWDNQSHTCTSLWQYAVDHIITDVRLLIVLVLKENIII